MVFVVYVMNVLWLLVGFRVTSILSHTSERNFTVSEGFSEKGLFILQSTNNEKLG